MFRYLYKILFIGVLFTLSCKNDYSTKNTSYFYKPNGLSHLYLFQSKPGFYLWFDKALGDVVDYKQDSKFSKSFVVFQKKEKFKVQLTFQAPCNLNVAIESATSEKNILKFRRAFQNSLIKLNTLNNVFLRNNYDTAINFYYTQSNEGYYHFYNYFSPLRSHIVKFYNTNVFVYDTTLITEINEKQLDQVAVYNKVLQANSEINYGKKSEGIYYIFTDDTIASILSLDKIYIAYNKKNSTKFSSKYNDEKINEHNFLHLFYKGSSNEYFIPTWVSNYYVQKMGLKKNSNVYITPFYNPLLEKNNNKWGSAVMKILEE